MKHAFSTIINTTRTKPIPSKRMEQLAEIIIRGEKTRGSVNIVLIGDTRMKTLNSKYRGVSKTTDVLSFSFDDDDGDQPPSISGEIYISVPQAAKQARGAGHELADELLFLTSHGILHILGHTHETMRKFNAMIDKQMRYLNILYGKS